MPMLFLAAIATRIATRKPHVDVEPELPGPEIGMFHGTSAVGALETL
jgi:hypothetical protein